MQDFQLFVAIMYNITIALLIHFRNNNIMKLLLLISLLSSSFMCFAEDSVSNADLNRKLDLILQKVDGLEERVSQLESDNALVKQEVEEVAKSAKEAKTATESLQIPQDEKEKRNRF